MEAEVNDGNPRRDFVEYDHPEGLYTLEAHHVTPDTEGEVTVPGGQTVKVRSGQVLVRRGPNYYDVHSGEDFEDLGLVATRDQNDLDQWEKVEEEPEVFDPNEHTAREVRLYLRNPGLSDEERERVMTAEREGRNRSSAFPE